MRIYNVKISVLSIIVITAIALFSSGDYPVVFGS